MKSTGISQYSWNGLRYECYTSTKPNLIFLWGMKRFTLLTSGLGRETLFLLYNTKLFLVTISLERSKDII